MESEDVPEQPMTPLKTAILQAHQGMAQLTSGKASTMREIADKLKMDRSYLARTLQLANLAPDIVKLIWENRQPETLTLDKLRKGIPESWEEQRKLFISAGTLEQLEIEPVPPTEMKHSLKDCLCGIRIKDSGPGVPKDLAEKIFEPFFTTKPTGKGTGMGLSMSYGVALEHNGWIQCNYDGTGAVFTLILPIKQD